MGTLSLSGIFLVIRFRNKEALCRRIFTPPTDLYPLRHRMSPIAMRHCLLSVAEIARSSLHRMSAKLYKLYGCHHKHGIICSIRNAPQLLARNNSISSSWHAPLINMRVRWRQSQKRYCPGTGREMSIRRCLPFARTVHSRSRGSAPPAPPRQPPDHDRRFIAAAYLPAVDLAGCKPPEDKNRRHLCSTGTT